MEDENGLELSLGLSFGGSFTKPKGKSGSSSDLGAEEAQRTTKMVDEFKNFLNGVDQEQESGTGSQRSTLEKPQENFFRDLSKAGNDADASINSNGKAIWVSDSHRPSENVGDKMPEAGSKRKVAFNDMNHHKKLEREADDADIRDKKRTLRISITEEGSTAENEDVAESEVEGSTSRLGAHHDDGSKRQIGITASSEASREINRVSNSKAVDLQGQKRFNISSEKESKMGNYGASFPVQSFMNVPYSISAKESNSIGAFGTSSHPLPTMMQTLPPSSSEQSGMLPVAPSNLPLMFGYPSMQLPVLDKNSSWVPVSHGQQMRASHGGKAQPNSASLNVVAHASSESSQFEGRTSDRTKGDGKQLVAEEGSSSQTGEDGKGGSTSFKAKDVSERSTTEGFSSAFPSIKPGIAADVKFGGCGSYPDLPWVSTTGPGPNGRTISGVTYIYNSNQIKIVCACHGCHMSPEEFIRHASEEHVNQESGAALATYQSSNPPSSQS